MGVFWPRSGLADRVPARGTHEAMVHTTGIL